MFQTFSPIRVHGVWFPVKDLKESPKRLSPYKDLSLQPTKAIQTIFKEGKVKNEDGKIIKLTDAVDPYEGYFLYSVIKENKFKNILEIGMANGMSALYMCSALKENGSMGKLISIDPFQSTQWKNTGIQTLRDAKLLKQHKLIEELDYLALPSLLNQIEEGKLEKFDLIFIDGNHLFDYTVLDFFYAVKMLHIGGVIVVDDIRHKNTGKAYKYIQTNYTTNKNYPSGSLKEVKGTLNSATQGTFVKVKEDERPWNFHKDF